MTEIARRKNFLIIEGRLLAEGKRGHLTPEEWMYAYTQIADELIGAQVEVFAGLEKRIRNRIVERALAAAAD